MSRGRPVGSGGAKLTNAQSEIVFILLETQFGKFDRYPKKQYEWARRIVLEFPSEIEKYSNGKATAASMQISATPPTPPPIQAVTPQIPVSVQIAGGINVEPVAVEPEPVKRVAKAKDPSPLDLLTPGNPEPEHKRFVPEVDPHYWFPPSLLKRICTELSLMEIIMLVGHMGTGKTSLFEQIGARIGQPVFRVNLNGQCSILDFKGQMVLKPLIDEIKKTHVGVVTQFLHGVLPLAMKYGWWLILDEIEFGEAHILACLNIFDRKPATLILQENGGEPIVAHANFRLLATGNTPGCMERFRRIYQGTNYLNQAFLDRWCVSEVPYMPEKEETKLLVRKIGLDEELASQLVNVANRCRESFAQDQLKTPFSTRRLLHWAQYCKVYNDVNEAAQSTIYGKVNQDDAKTIELMIANCVKTAEVK